MRNSIRYLILPSVPTFVLFGLYFTPTTVIPCATRGLLAFGVVLAALLVGIVIGIIGIGRKRAGDPNANWLALATAILAVPALLLLGPLG